MADRLDPTFVRQQIANLRVTHPDIMDDEEEYQLALASETEFFEFLEVLVTRILDTREQVDGVSARLARNKQRKEHFEERIKAMRELVRNLMEAAGEKKVPLNEATVYLRTGTPHVIITAKSVDELPPDLIRIRKEPNLEEIHKRLKNGETVEGAVLSNPENTISIR